MCVCMDQSSKKLKHSWPKVTHVSKRLLPGQWKAAARISPGPARGTASTWFSPRPRAPARPAEASGSPPGGAARPQPALPGAGPARQSRGRLQPPSCGEGWGRGGGPRDGSPNASPCPRRRVTGGPLERNVPYSGASLQTPRGALSRRERAAGAGGRPRTSWSELQRMEMQISSPPSAAFRVTAWGQQDPQKGLKGQNKPEMRATESTLTSAKCGVRTI